MQIEVIYADSKMHSQLFQSPTIVIYDFYWFVEKRRKKEEERNYKFPFEVIKLFHPSRII